MNNGMPRALRIPGVPGIHVPALLCLALVCLVVGLTVPIVVVRQFWVFEGSYSILGSIALLLREGEVFIGTILLGFSVLLPGFKIVALIATWLRLRRGGRAPHRLATFLEVIGKWSMLDVLVVALIVFAAKAGPLVDAEVAPAIVPFVASIGLTLYCARAIRSAAAKAASRSQP